MADVATVSLRVDTAQVVKGTKELIQFEKQAVKANAATNNINKASKLLTNIINELTKAVNNVQRQITTFNSGLIDNDIVVKNAIVQNQQLTAVFQQQADVVSALARASSGLGGSGISVSGIQQVSTAIDELHFTVKEVKQELSTLTADMDNTKLTDIAGLFMPDVGESGLFKKMLTLKGAGITTAIAGVISLGKAYMDGASEGEEFNRQLIMTGGQAGVTAAELSRMAKEIDTSVGTIADAAGALSTAVGTGNFFGEQLKHVAAAAVAMQESTGQSINRTIADFQLLAKDPVKGIETLNDKYHMFTATIYEQVNALAAQGRKQEAVNLVIKLGSEEMIRRNQAVVNSLTGINKFIHESKNLWREFWDGAENLGRETDVEAKLEKKLAHINKLIESKNKFPKGVYNPYELGYSYSSDYKTVGKHVTLEEERSKISEKLANVRKGKTDALERSEKQLASEEIIFERSYFDRFKKNIVSPIERRTEEYKRLNDFIEKSLGEGVQYSPEQIALWRDGIARNDPDMAVSTPTKIDSVNNNSEIPKPIGRNSIVTEKPISILEPELKKLELLKEENKAIKIQGDMVVGLNETEKRIQILSEQVDELKEKGKVKQLSLQEQLNLAEADELKLAILNNEQQEKANQAKTKELELQLQMKSQAEVLDRSRNDIVEQRGMSKVGIQQWSEKQQLQRDFEKGGGNLDDKDAKATQEYLENLNKVDTKFQEMQISQMDWKGGASAAIQDWANDAMNLSGAIGNVATTALNGISDQLMLLATTGKTTLKEFGLSMLKMIIEIINKLLVAQAVQMAMGWLGIGAAGGAGGATGAGAAMAGHSGGGYTGDGGKYEAAGIVHRGEFVMTKEATSRIGVGNLYAMMRGYVDGGLVAAQAPQLGFAGAGAQGNTINTTVIVQQGGGQQSRSNSNDSVGKAYQQVIDKSVRDGIARETTPGGIIWNATQRR